LEELMMNMLSLIADQVRTRQELFDQEGRIMQVLLNQGYHLQEADAALTLMQQLVTKEAASFFGPERTVQALRIRTMTREERGRFTADAFGFAVKLALLGIISEDQREDLIEKAMAAYSGRIDLDCIKSLVAFILFLGPREFDHSPLFDLRQIKNTAWN
jgi:uncharacterized protein Smg (DUF494 family)